MEGVNEKAICRSCGNDDVTCDAWASWNVIKQEWVLHSTYDDTFCQKCETSQKVDFVPAEFPFEEIRRADGNYFDSWQQAAEEGFPDNQIWSVTSGENSICYGPPHHYVNHIGHIATAEKHNGNTYYEETFEEEDSES
jgi:hypothetical protein